MATKTNQGNNEDLYGSIRLIQDILNNVLEEVRDNNYSCATTTEKLSNISAKVDILSKIVRDGNGTPSLITRMSLVEDKIDDIKECIGGIRWDVKDHIDDSKADKKFHQEKSLSWLKIFAVVSPGLLALVMVILKYLGVG